MASIYYSGPKNRRRYWTFDTRKAQFVAMPKAKAETAIKSIFNRLHKKPAAAAVRQALRANPGMKSTIYVSRTPAGRQKYWVYSVIAGRYRSLTATDARRLLNGKAAKPLPRGANTSRRNPDSEETAAAKLSERFHGRPARKVRDLTSEHTERYALAELGRLQELIVIPASGKALQLTFTQRPRLCSSPEGGALYLEGGDQTLAPSLLGDKTGKDHLEIGAVLKIVYRTSKGFHDFEPSDYVHEFGEEGGTLPTLAYDRLNRRMYLIGGTYKVRPEGITN